ncbi:hypothetical protein TSEDIMI_60055 [Tenacibaculum sediminilitoris]|uniref:gliding motility-associated C-terminal domain-containing protein n=1 Tax=Tenacibaculum sediminilitoris TaxID=1820334 RepID=UPI00389444F1
MKKTTFLQGGMKEVLLIFVLAFSITANAQITPFTMTLTPTDETCTGNGEITIDINGTQTGADFELQFYQLPNTATSYAVNTATSGGNTLQYIKTNLPSGNWQVTAIQTVGIETNQQTATVTIGDNRVPLAFTAKSDLLCANEHEVNVNVTAGNPVTYELRDITNNVVITPQASSTLSPVAAGDYIVVVTDVCGDSASLGITIADISVNYSVFRKVRSIYGFYALEDCSTYNHIDRVLFNGSANAIPDALFPIQLTYTVEDPLGGAPTVINSTWNSGTYEEQVSIPFYDGQTYNYTVDLVDACGNTYSQTDIIRAAPNFRIISFASQVCGQRYLRLDLIQQFLTPFDVTFTDYPAGFDPSGYNANYTAGTYTASFNTLGNLFFGDDTNPVPDGSYTIVITDSCGRTVTRSITATSNTNFSLVKSRVHNGCADDEGNMLLYIRSAAGSTQAAEITNMIITAAPAAYTSSLPDDVSTNITTDGKFSMNSLPVGTYTFEAQSSCGTTETASFTIDPLVLEPTVTPTFNCGSFNLDASLTTNLGDPDVYLQKYYPDSGQWGHPTTGRLHVEGNFIATNTGMRLLAFNNRDGVKTVSASYSNIASTGLMRVILQAQEYPNGGNGTPSFSCLKTVKTFNVPENSVLSNNYYVSACPNGNTELIIDAIGVAPLNYKITEFNGTPLVIDNGTNPVFTDLVAGEYKVEIDDNCGNTSVFTFKTSIMKSPIIYPNNLCDGQNGSLFLSGLSFLNIEWTKGADPTVLATGNTLNFAPYTEATDAGTYYAHLSYSGNLAACLAETLSFTVTAPQDVPEAGTGQTVDILQSDVGLINLFDYDTAPYDNWGSWTDLSNTGTLNNEIWDATNMPVGTYQFQYDVSSACSGLDTTTVTINIIASDLTANQDDFTVSCPYTRVTNIGNVMDNDTEFSNLVVKANYTVSEEIRDPGRAITVNVDGTVDVSIRSQPGQTYTLQYRIAETANTDNYTIGTLNVTIGVDTTPPIFNGPLPVDVTVECDAIPIAEDLTATDECQPAYVTYTDTTTAGVCSGNYTLTRVWIAQDLSGNQVSHTQTITVQDTTPPTFVEALPADTTVECDAIPVAETLTAVDAACSSPVSTLDWSNSNRWFPGVLSQSYTVGNTNINFNVTYPSESSQPFRRPTTAFFLYQGDQPVTKQTLNISAILPALQDGTVTTDFTIGDLGVGVDNLNFKIFDVDGELAEHLRQERYVINGYLNGNLVNPNLTVSGTQIISGNTVLGYDPTDPIKGNSIDGVLNVRFPSPVDRVEILFSIDDGSSAFPTSQADFAIYNINFEEINQAEPVTVSFSETTTAGACAGESILTREWTATDECGNTTVHTQNITVQDTTPPTFVEALPADTTVECDAIPVAETLTATDTCGTATVTINETTTAGACAGESILTREWTATDECGNTTVHTQNITVQDTTPPTFVEALPADTTVECDAIPVAETLTATDTCGTATVTINETTTAGACAGESILTREWTATDECGNTTVHTQNITVQDTTPPTFVEALPADTTVECDAIPVAETLTATDTCGTATVTINETTTAGACAGESILTREWTATDECGNTAVHTQNITVQDTTPPTFVEVLPADTTVECDAIPVAETLTATDTCGTTTVTINETTTAGACAGESILTREWTATDECGNSTSHTQVIIIEDNEAPQLVSTLEDITVECDNVPEVPTLEFTDNCSSNVTQTNFEETSTFDGSDSDYTIMRTWTVADDCGNEADFTQYITVTVKTSVIEIADSRCTEDGVIELNDYLANQNAEGTWEVTQGSVVLSDDASFDPSGLSLGDYVFTYTISNNGCLIVTKVTISINEECISIPCRKEDVVISKVVTPNGDSRNEFFEIKGVESCGFIANVKIFNRWGAKVFESNNYANNWNRISDGATFGGAERLPAGTYYYIVILENSGLKPFTGAIYLGIK